MLIAHSVCYVTVFQYNIPPTPEPSDDEEDSDEEDFKATNEEDEEDPADSKWNEYDELFCILNSQGP